MRSQDCRSERAGAMPVRGFTLVELLVVIGIIALLISILMPSLQKARAAANTVKCASNMRQLGQAVHNYVAEQRGAFPFAYVSLPNDPPNTFGGWVWSFDDALDPYLMKKNYTAGQHGGTPSAPLTYEVLSCPEDLIPVSTVAGANKIRKTYALVANIDWSVSTGSANAECRGVAYITGKRTVANGGSYTNPKFKHVKPGECDPGTLLAVEMPHKDNIVGYGGNGAAAGDPQTQLSHVPKPYHNKLFNYLFVDGHVEALTPFETVGTGTWTNPKGMWTRVAND